MILRAWPALALAAVVLAGCATTGPSPSAAHQEPPRVRCLNDPTETSMRPLVFFF